jgi:transcriptional regulator with XRE-family HTH domain
MDIQAKIGQRIKEIRTGKKLTQEAVAFKGEIDRSFMNHVENGRRNVSVETLEKIISSGLETDFKEFFNADVFSDKKKNRIKA